MSALPLSTAYMRGLWPLLTSLVTKRVQYGKNVEDTQMVNVKHCMQ